MYETIIGGEISKTRKYFNIVIVVLTLVAIIIGISFIHTSIAEIKKMPFYPGLGQKEKDQFELIYAGGILSWVAYLVILLPFTFNLFEFDVRTR